MPCDYQSPGVMLYLPCQFIVNRFSNCCTCHHDTQDMEISYKLRKSNTNNISYNMTGSKCLTAAAKKECCTLERKLFLFLCPLSNIGKALVKHRTLGVPIICYYEFLRLSVVLPLSPFHKSDLLLHL